MRRLSAFIVGIAALPSFAQAQTAGHSVLVPPNAIDRATAASDQRNADARRAADVDRLNADIARRSAESQTGPIPQSTMTDGVSGYGTTTAAGSASAPPNPPQR